jgi:2,3-dihydro-2,3-dihydroxybenzoate dehydrogenase
MTSPVSAARAETAVVVGGARGIGAAVARALAAQPDVGRVVIADVLDEESRALANELDAQGCASDSIDVDLADSASVAALIAATTDAGRVCVATGIFDSDSALDTSRETFERILAVNLIGNYEVSQGYARAMAARGGGSIVAIASVAARQPRLLQAAYSASKAGMRQALRVLGLEVAARGVRVNFVSPGPTDTEMMRRLASDHTTVQDLAQGRIDAYRTRIPSGSVATPDEVAAAVVFLLSPAASHVTLHDLVVDGGELLGM